MNIQHKVSAAMMEETKVPDLRSSAKIRVLFAPDYRDGLPYQDLLAKALVRHGVEVSFLTDYRRGLPLFRGSFGNRPDIVHIHFPEKYFRKSGDRWDKLRVLRY